MISIQWERTQLALPDPAVPHSATPDPILTRINRFLQSIGLPRRIKSPTSHRAWPC